MIRISCYVFISFTVNYQFDPNENQLVVLPERQYIITIIIEH